MDGSKRTHTIVIDAGPIIKNEPPVSTLLAQAEQIISVPAIVDEIRDSATRSRFETTIKPFLTLRNPKPESIKFVQDFARKTGDVAVLSRQDIQIIALAYELECEKNGGDWRLRNVPGQKQLNGAPPKKSATKAVVNEVLVEPSAEINAMQDTAVSGELNVDPIADADADNAQDGYVKPSLVQLEKDTQNLGLTENDAYQQSDDALAAEQSRVTDVSEDDSSDSEGWITPSNLRRKQEEDSNPGTSSAAQAPKMVQVATITTDNAMQNVLLQINLNIFSPGMHRIRRLNTYVLRCHACFQVVRDMSKQFCPRCGQPTLTRVACSTNENGEFRLHLKKNMQWNTRGDRYSIPKPVAGSASGRNAHKNGGGKGGWGQDLILAEDQKEYTKAVKSQQRRKKKDLMDEDILPSILTGDRSREYGKPKIGAGRSVNSRKR